MGTSFDCGCRVSGGMWVLCSRHEGLLLSKIEIDRERGNGNEQHGEERCRKDERGV